MTLAGAYLWTEYCAGAALELDAGDGQELADGLLGSRDDRLRVAGATVEADSLGRAERVGDGHRHADDGIALRAVAAVEEPPAGQSLIGGDAAGPLVKTDVPQEVRELNRAVRFAYVEPGLQAAQSAERGVLAVGGSDDDL